MDLDTRDNQETAYKAALAYLMDAKYQFEERYPWNTFVSKLDSDMDMEATIANMYFVEGLDDTPDYFVVLITLKSGSQPAAVQVGLPKFDILRAEAIDLSAGEDIIMSVVGITRQPSLPQSLVWVNIRIRDLPRDDHPQDGSKNSLEYKLQYRLQTVDIVNSSLVWKPCRQSFSPFLPFYKVVVKDKSQTLPVGCFYLRADFAVDPEAQTVNKTGFVEFDTTSLGF